MSEKLNPGQFPIMRRGFNDARFVRHSQSMPSKVTLPSGELVETGYLKVTDGETYDLYSLCQNDGNSAKLAITELVYIDEGDNLCVHPIKHLAPVLLADPAYVAKGKAGIVIGYVTKLCGLRWGFVMKLDPTTGRFSLETDLESPVVGIKIRFS